MSIQRILVQGGWFLLGNLATRAVFFLATLVFTRIFLPEAFGAFVLVKTAVVFAAVLDTWLIECVMRFRPQVTHRESLRAFNRVLRRLVGLHLAVVIVPAAFWLGQSEGDWAVFGRYALAIYLFDFAYRLNLQLLRIQGKVSAYNGYSFIYAVSRLALSLFLVFLWKHDIAAILWAWIAVGALLLPVMSRSAWPLPREISPANSETTPARVAGFREMAAYGLPFVGLALGWTGLYLADRFMLQHFCGNAEVGLYGVNYSFAELAHFLPYMLISFPAYPALIKLWETKGLAALQETVYHLAKPYLLLAIPLIAGMAVLAPRLLTLCTTPDYAAAATAIAWLAPGLLGWGLLAFFNIPFMVMMRTRLLAALGLSALALNVLLNLFAIPALGLYGASGATSVTYLLLATGAWWTGARVLKLPIKLPGTTFRNALLAAAGMVLLLIPLNTAWPQGWSGLIGLAAAGALTYGTGLLVLRELSINDIEGATRRLLPRLEVQA